MAVTETEAMVLEEEPSRYIEWGPIIAGAVAAAALALVLQAFATAIGLAISSTSPTWRDSSSALHVLSGLYLLLTALAAFALGGYVAGRMRAPLNSSADEIEFRDGTHGLAVWSVAMFLIVLMTWVAAQSLTRFTAPPGSAQSVAGENIIAYDLDRLLRPADRRPEGVDLNYARSEAARILLTSAGHDGIAADDRTYLAKLTALATGLTPPEAEQRANTIITQAHDSIRKARQSAVILAFMAGAAALVGVAVSWYAACAGGEHRDRRSTPSQFWSFSSRRA